MFKRYFLFLLIFISPVTSAQSTKTFFSTDVPFSNKDVTVNIDEWGVCAAIYDLFSELQKTEAPATSEQFYELANGARMALAMRYLSAIKETDDPGARGEMAILLMNNVPETKLTQIMADAELTGFNSKFVDKATASLEVCMANGKLQQFWVDAWRELYSSGAFK